MIKIIIASIIIQTCLFAYPGQPGASHNPSLVFLVLSIMFIIDSFRQFYKENHFWAFIELFLGILTIILIVVINMKMMT